jgi:hypothetical protein
MESIDWTTSPALDLAAVRRESTPIRLAFLHQGGRGGGAGPLSWFVQERQSFAFDLLLFAHTVWPLSEGSAIRATTRQWMTAMSIKETAESRSTVSRSWRWLEARELVRAPRSSRERGIELLQEDGSGRSWTSPGAVGDPYFRLPHAYWTGAFARDLSLPAKAVLLIGLSRQSRGQEYFELPLRRGAAWYGISSSTVRRGLNELRSIHLLRRWAEERETSASPTGRTYDQRYALNSLVNVGAQRTYRSRGGLEIESGEVIPF